MPTTTRWALRYPALTDTADVPRDIGNLAADLDSVAFDDQGLLSARPVSTSGSPGKKGRYYWATDTGLLYRDNGTGWDTINPSIAVDAAAGVGSLRTLGTGALQAAAGNDARLSDQRTPLDGSVTGAKIAPALLPSQGAANATEALRAIGAGAGQVVSGADARLTDQRTPLDGSVTAVKVANALKPSQGAAAGTEALRALGTSASTAAAGNDARLADQRTPLDGSVTGPKLSTDLRNRWEVAGVISLDSYAPWAVTADGSGAWTGSPTYMIVSAPPIPAGTTRTWRIAFVGLLSSAVQIGVRDVYRPAAVNHAFTGFNSFFIGSWTVSDTAAGYTAAANADGVSLTNFEAYHLGGGTVTFYIYTVQLAFRDV